MHKKANPPYLKALASGMRSKPTRAETLLWGRIRDRRLHKIRFRRQHIIGRYIADFFAYLRVPDCPGIVIELDGSTHDKNYDEIRDAWMRAQGYLVLRYSNERIESELEVVLNEIEKAVSSYASA